MRINAEVLGTFEVSKVLDFSNRFDHRRAFTRAGLAVEHAARMKSPYRTGHLRRNIISTATEAYAEIGVSLLVVPYAWYQEAGTSRIQAHPYLRPALQSEQHNIVRIFQDEMRKAIKK